MTYYLCLCKPGPEVINVLFSCSTQLSMKISLLINMKCQQQFAFSAFSYLLAEKFSCLIMFSKKEFGIVSKLRYNSRTKSSCLE